MQFLNGATVLGTSPVAAGRATEALTGVAAGSYSYTAKFIPTSAAAFTPSTSSAATFVVTAPVAVPTASFTASAISGIAPLAVTLTDTSTGAPTSWLWTFGNGSTSNAQNPPVVSYTTAGTYTVTLIATNATGASAPVSKTITVTSPTTSDARILWMSRDRGSVGDYVLIKGSGFGTSGVVNFGTLSATVSYWSSQWIVVKVPAGNVDGTNVGVTVTPSGGTASNAVSFRLDSDDGDDGDDDAPSHQERLGGDFD